MSKTNGGQNGRMCLNIEGSYRIQFGSRLPCLIGILSTVVGPEQAQVMEQEVKSLLIKEAIERLHPPGFYSQYFIVPKKDGGCIQY